MESVEESVEESVRLAPEASPEPAGDDGNVLGPERHGHHPEGDHDLAHAEPERHRERARRRKTREPRRRGALLRS